MPLEYISNQLKPKWITTIISTFIPLDPSNADK